MTWQRLLSLLLFVAVCPCVYSLSCRDVDPQKNDKCCFPPTATVNVSETTSYDISLATLDQVKECFGQLGKMSQQAKQDIVDNLLAKLRSMYVFYDIVQDSSVVEPCNANNYKVHQMKYDVEAALQLALVQSSQADFFSSVARAFRQLNDAHTQFWTPFHPWHYIRPIVLSSRLSPAGVQEVYIAAINPLMELLNVSSVYPQPPWKDFLNKTVKNINSIDALTYIKDKADTVGMYKSRGVRLNEFLKGAFFSLGKFDMPSSTSEIYQFPDQATIKATLLVAITDPRTSNGTASLKEYLTSAEGARMTPAKGSQVLSQAVAYHRAVSLASQSKSWELKKSSQSFGNIAVLFEVDDSLVLKLPGELGTSQSNAFLLINLIETFIRAMKLAASKNYKTLIVDVIGNNGGVLSAAYWLMAAMAGKTLQDPAKLCELYDMRESPFWDMWVKSFASRPWVGTIQELSESQMEELFELIVTQNKDFQENFDQDYSSFYKTAVEPNLVVPLQKVMSNGASPKDQLDNVKGILTKFLRQQPFKLNMAEPEWFPLVQHTNPSPSAPDYTNLSWYRKPIRRTRGGKSGFYSQKFFQGCVKDLQGIAGLWQTITYYFKEIVFLTDGTCGGACSLILSKLQVENYAHVVSIGGLSGETMDTSFAGGYIEDFPEFFEEVRLSQLLGHVLFGVNETWSELTKPSAPVKFTMTMNELYLRKLGSCALPREWYLIPADRHLDVWLSQADDWPSPDHHYLLQIYRQLARIYRPTVPVQPTTVLVTTTDTSGGSGLPQGALLGIIISCGFAALIVAVLIYVKYKHYKQEPMLALRRPQETPINDESNLLMSGSEYTWHDD